MSVVSSMVVGRVYVVWRGSDDGTFVAGDRIRLNADGSVDNKRAEGWLEAGDLPEATQGMQISLTCDDKL